MLIKSTAENTMQTSAQFSLVKIHQHLDNGHTLKCKDPKTKDLLSYWDTGWDQKINLWPRIKHYVQSAILDHTSAELPKPRPMEMDYWWPRPTNFINGEVKTRQ